MSFPYRKLLCPLAFDENSFKALDHAIEMARHFGARIVLVHVVPMVVQYGEVPIPFEFYEKEQNDARQKLDDIARQQLDGIQHDVAVYTGDVAGSILAAIAKFSPDLVVMATHGRAGFAHLFLGSVAETVVRKATCPVLTVRTGH